MKRESFKSRLGFILVSAGCAIGIGNVWRFPYVVGENGGGLFVILYLVFLIAMGLPVLTMELAVGRASRKSALLGYKALEKPGSKWHLHGWAAIFGCYMLMMYYTTVSGWMVTYFYKFLIGEFQAGMDAEAAGAVFSNLLGRPVADELLDDTHGHSWLFCVQQRIAEWSGKNKQSHDECLAWPDRDPCGTQFYIIRCGRGCPFLSDSEYGNGEGSGHWKCRFSGNESGVLYLKSRSCSHGDLWKLYGS